MNSYFFFQSLTARIPRSYIYTVQNFDHQANRTIGRKNHSHDGLVISGRIQHYFRSCFNQKKTKILINLV